MRGSVIVGAEGVTNASLSTPATIADTSNQTTTTTNMTQSTQGQDISLQESPIVLNAKKIDNSTYVWESNGTNNPTLNLLVGKEYTVVVKSIVGDPAEHELKVALPGGTGIEAEDFLESESVDQGEQTQVSFTPTGVGEFRYYCEYHPESMVGMLNVVNTNSSGINNQTFTPGNQGPFQSDDEDDGGLDDDGDDDDRGRNRGRGGE
jgi:plastocyanin